VHKSKEKDMKRLFVVVLLVFVPLIMAAQPQRIKFQQSGEFATLTSAPDPLSNFNLTVSRTASTTSGAGASLQYFAVTATPDFSSETVVEIIASIPASAFTGNTTKSLVLDLDTSTLDSTTSILQTCTIDLNTFTVVCAPGPFGLIHLEFAENGVQRTQVLDFNEVVTSGTTVTHIHQRSDNSTANVQGSIFGVPVVGASATVGVNRDLSVEVFRRN